MNQPLAIGFIGLGVMGAPMAGHLARAGHSLTLLDANAEIARDLAATLGAKAATTPAEVAARSDIVITMLPNGSVPRAIWSIARPGVATTTCTPWLNACNWRTIGWPP